MPDFLQNKKFIIVIVTLLVTITLLTKFYGATDIADYSDTAKYFSGKYVADIRSSHSYLYGFLHAPFVAFFENFFIFKITSLLFLFALIYSVYWISGKNKKAFLLMIFSPVLWYMAPWISPIQFAAFCLLWAWYFIRKYDVEKEIKHLVCSGIFVGLGWAVWDTIAFFGFFLLISFLYNRKLNHAVIAVLAVFIGMLPRFILDHYLFNFFLFSTMKSFFGTLANAFFLHRGTTYVSTLMPNIIFFILILVSLPLYWWTLYTKEKFHENKKSIIFISLTLLLIIINPQIRYTLAIMPIITVLLLPNISLERYKKQIIFSAIILIIFVAPMAVQIRYSFNNSSYYDITECILHANNLYLSKNFQDNVLAQDLQTIANDFPHEEFLVGGLADNYQRLSHFYWGNQINKLVSIQDYMLWKNNETVLFEKKFQFSPKINDRRSIWIGGGIEKNPNDATKYETIKYALTINDEDSIEGFQKIKKYAIITIWAKK